MGFLHHLYYNKIQGFTIVQRGGCVAFAIIMGDKKVPDLLWEMLN